MRNDIICSLAHNLEYSKFSTIWLRLQCHSQTKFIYVAYISPSFSNYVKLFNYYLTSKVGYILFHFPNADISILGDFNVHLQLWLSSYFTDQPDEQAFNFVIYHDLEQLVQFCNRIPDCIRDTPNILDFFLISKPLTKSVNVSSSFGSSDHKFISVTCSISLLRP